MCNFLMDSGGRLFTDMDTSVCKTPTLADVPCRAVLGASIGRSYTLARRWVRNDPEVDVESIVGPVS